MDSAKEKILSIVQQNSLFPEEIYLWERILEDTPNDLIGDLLWFLEKIPDGLRIMTSDLKEKAEILKSGDLVRWEESLEKNTKLFDTLSAQHS